MSSIMARNEPRSPGRRVYDNAALLKMITDHLSIKELAGLLALEKAFLPVGMDFLGQRCEFPERVRLRRRPSFYYDPLRGSVRTITMRAELFFRDEHDASRLESDPHFFAVSTLSDLVKQYPRLRSVEGPREPDIFRPNGDPSEKPFWRLDRWARTIFVRNYRAVEAENLRDGDLGCRIDLSDNWPDYSIDHRLSVKLALSRKGTPRDQAAIDTAFGDPRVFEIKLIGPKGSHAIILAAGGLRHRQKVHGHEAEKLTRIVIDVNSEHLLNLEPLFTSHAPFTVLTMLVELEMHQLPGWIERTTWPVGCLVRIISEWPQFSPTPLPECPTHVIDIALQEPINLTFADYMEITKRLGARLTYLDVPYYDDYDYAPGFDELQLFVDAIGQYSPSLTTLSIALTMPGTLGNGDTKIRATSTGHSCQLERLHLNLVGMRRPSPSVRLRRLYFIASNVVMLCSLTTIISTTTDDEDTDDSSDTSLAQPFDDEERILDFVQWMLELNPNQRQAVRTADIAELLGPLQFHPQILREIQFDADDQPIPLQYSRMARELAKQRRRGDDTLVADSEQVELAKRRLEQWAYISEPEHLH